MKISKTSPAELPRSHKKSGKSIADRTIHRRGRKVGRKGRKENLLGALCVYFASSALNNSFAKGLTGVLHIQMERLQKLISAAGVASRRHAEELIKSGQVTLNGKVIKELGTKADPETDHIKVRGKLINPLLKSRENVYVLLNKPRGFLSSVSDDRGRPVVLELLPKSLGSLHPVGRLDFNTEGLLLLTNDGDFTNFITAARNHVQKVYEVKLKGVPPEEALERLRRGVVLEDGTRTAAARITRLRETEHNSWFEVTLHQGRNQQIRRMFELIGYSVVKLRRVRIGFLQDTGLRPGEWRLLTVAEVNRLITKRRPERKKGAVKSHAASRG